MDIALLHDSFQIFRSDQLDNGSRCDGAHPFDTGNWFACDDMGGLRDPVHGARGIDCYTERVKGAAELSFATRGKGIGEKRNHRRGMRCGHRRGALTEATERIEVWLTRGVKRGGSW